MLLPKDFAPASVQDLSVVTPLVAQKALAGLVYSSKTYLENTGYYGNVYAKITAAVAAALAFAPPNPPAATDPEKETFAVGVVMAAVAYKLNNTIGVVVSDEGTQDSRSYYESRENWDALAKDVLNEFYLPLGAPGSMTDNAFIITDRMPFMGGWCQGNPDEAMLSMRSRYRGYHPYIIGSISNGQWGW